MEIADNNVQYLGYIEHHDPLLHSAYDACEILALPSTLETPGLAALETGASNTKILPKLVLQKNILVNMQHM